MKTKQYFLNAIYALSLVADLVFVMAVFSFCLYIFGTEATTPGSLALILIPPYVFILFLGIVLTCTMKKTRIRVLGIIARIGDKIFHVA